MNLREYLDTMNKTCCQDDCDFKNKKEIEIAKIPPPNEIAAVLISQDPTVDWAYKCLKSEREENTRRKLLFASAIPLFSITKILIFMRRGNLAKDDDEKHLFDMIFQKTYWTHLHKCFTDKRGKESIKFKPKNAKKCADTWLEKELDLAISEGAKFVIALGDRVKSWVETWNRSKGLEVISLPHPSGQNNVIWYRSKKNKYKKTIRETEEQIRRLLKLSKEVEGY